MKKIKLPPLSRFKSATDTCPFEKLYLWAYRRTLTDLSKSLYSYRKLPPGKVLNVSAFKLNPTDEDRMKKVVIEWLDRKCQRSQKRLEGMYAWINLDIGPGTTNEEPGYIYIEDNYLRDKENS